MTQVSDRALLSMVLGLPPGILKEKAAAPTGGPLLDSIIADNALSNPEFAFSSSRKLLGVAANTSPFQLKRSSDNALINASYNADSSIDTDTLGAFIGANDGFVETISNQANGDVCTKLVANDTWRIYAAGALVESSFPTGQNRVVIDSNTAASFDSVRFVFPSPITLTNFTIFFSFALNTGAQYIGSLTNGNDNEFYYFSRMTLRVGGANGISNNFGVSNEALRLATVTYDAGDFRHWLDGAANGAGVLPVNPFTVSSFLRGGPNVYIAELVAFDEVLSDAVIDEINTAMMGD